MDVPRTHVRLTKGNCYPPELEERSSRIVGGDTLCFESGHIAMISIPDQVAALLRRLHKGDHLAADPSPS